MYFYISNCMVWVLPMIGVDAIGMMEAVGMIDPDDYTSPEIYCHGRLQQSHFLPMHIGKVCKQKFKH